MVDQLLAATVWPTRARSALASGPFAVAAVIACILAEGAALRVGIDDLDEGYFLEQAVRVLHGQVPYRDFETLYSPGLVYVHAGLFAALGGPDLLAPRLLSLAARSALALLVFALTRPFVRYPVWAAAPAVVLLIGLDDAPVRWEPHPGWPSTVFVVLGTWCVLGRATGVARVGAAAAAALAFVFKQNTGALFLVALLVWLPRRHMPLVLASFVIATLVWFVPLASALWPNLLSLGGLLEAVNDVGLWSPPDPTNLVAVGCLAGAAWLIWRDPDPRLRWLSLSGTALFLTELPRMDTSHLVWSAPLLLVLGAIALGRARATVRVMSLACVAMLLSPTWTSRVAYVAQPLQPVAGVLVPEQTAASLESTIADVDRLTNAGDPIFVYPSSPLVYVLAGRPNPTRFDHLNPGAASAAQLSEAIGDIERARVRVVVVSNFWRAAWGDPAANATLERWIEANFTTTARHDDYEILVRNL